MRKRKSSFPVKPLSFTLIILLALCFVLGYIWRILTTADYFRVKDIVTRDVLSVDLSYLKGKNIFSLNLPREAASIARVCPDCSRVRLARIMPNRIYVELVRRKALAFLKLYRFFAVDEDGVIFFSSIQPDGANLPVITGLETKVFGPKPGMRCENRELSAALSILKEAARTPLLRGYKIQRINVAGIDNITAQIPLPQDQITYAGWKALEKKDFLEIKFGQGNIRDKVVIMAGLINQEKRNLNNIKYIDLRFNEPVIKFKDVK
ncbi:MAG: cell division protein FtsQ/DivIB [Candidatus Omnitrophota bacterium]|nr:cell division protein FtsQ/DivIB [Candidatus Omnitrophota bacterium]